MTPEDLNFVADLVRHHAGVVIRSDKAFFIETRLGSVARREKTPGVPALLDQLRRSPDPTLTRQVVEATLLQDTSFFRDRQVFAHLRQSVLPALASRGKSSLRILSAGCATGQEAYSVAMMAAEIVPITSVEIVALDFGARLLEKGRSGVYSHFEVQRGLPIHRLLSSFEAVDDSWRVRPELRQCIHWEEHNLLADTAGFGIFDLVLCRNVLTTLTPDAAQKVTEHLEGNCSPDGMLLTGTRDLPNLSAAFSKGGAPGLWVSNPIFPRMAQRH